MTLHRVDISGWKGQPVAGNMLLWAAIGGICLGIFSGDRPIFFLLFPLLIIAAFRLGQFGSAAAVGIISIVSTYVTVNGSGPFSAATMHEALLLQQGFYRQHCLCINGSGSCGFRAKTVGTESLGERRAVAHAYRACSCRDSPVAGWPDH